MFYLILRTSIISVQKLLPKNTNTSKYCIAGHFFPGKCNNAWVANKLELLCIQFWVVNCVEPFMMFFRHRSCKMHAVSLLKKALLFLPLHCNPKTSLTKLSFAHLHQEENEGLVTIEPRGIRQFPTTLMGAEKMS